MDFETKIDYLSDNISMVRLVDRMMVDSPLKTVNSARISYNKSKTEFDEKDTKLANFLWNHEHTSPFRHSYFTFHIKLPIFVARQLMKYQVGSGFRTYEINGEEVSLEVFDHFYDTDKGCSWNEVSGRYTQTSDEFYIPKKLRSNPGHGNKQSSGEYVNPLKMGVDGSWTPEDIILHYFEEHCKNSLALYDLMIENGVAKELARIILPQGMYTEAYWTCSLGAIIHFLSQRLSTNSQLEIRALAEGIYTLMKPDLDKLGLKKEDL